MPYPNKPLAEMTPDEIAQLSPEDFKELAHDHNHNVEQNERAYQDQIEVAKRSSDDELQFTEDNLRTQWKDLTPANEQQLSAVTDERVARYIAERDRRGITTSRDRWTEADYQAGKSPEIEKWEDHDPEVDALLDKLVDQQRKAEPEKFGKPLIPAIIEAVKEFPGTVREKMNPFEAIAKPKYVYEDDLENDNDYSNSR